MDKRFIALAAIVSIAAVLVGLRQCAAPRSRGVAQVAPADGPDRRTARSPVLPAAPGAEAILASLNDGELVADRDQLIAQLRARYGAHIDNPYVQMRMLEELIRHLQARYPDRWREILLDIIREAFPEFYDQIAATLDHRLDYEQWMNENRDRLQAMSKEERQAALWEARNRIFGADAAEQIWAAELKSRALGDALGAIDGQAGASIADRLDMYKQSIDDIHGDNAPGYMERHRHEVMNRFIGLESVQRQLSNMSAEERSQSLRQIRRGMGLDDAALARWDDLDRQRDQRWEQGLTYMTERKELVARYQGAELESRLDALRARYFGAEAEVIAREEESGLFRFERPRRWGQN